MQASLEKLLNALRHIEVHGEQNLTLLLGSIHLVEKLLEAAHAANAEGSGDNGR